MNSFLVSNVQPVGNYIYMVVLGEKYDHICSDQFGDVHTKLTLLTMPSIIYSFIAI